VWQEAEEFREIYFAFAVRKSNARAWITEQESGRKQQMHVKLKPLPWWNFLLCECDIRRCGKIFLYFLNNMTLRMQGNRFKLFSFGNLATRVYDFRKCGEVLLFF
jgi:hypothetical protein